jgi:dihydrofolate reductase
MMRELIYSMTTSLDGFIADPDGKIDWSVPDEELFRFHTERVRHVGVQLCGRRLYETMVYWETADRAHLAGPPQDRVLDLARQRRGQLADREGRTRRGSDAAQA